MIRLVRPGVFGMPRAARPYSVMVRATPGLVTYWPEELAVNSTSVAAYVMPAQFSMEIWLKYTVVNNNTGIFSMWSGGVGSMLVLDVGTGKIRLYCTSTGLDSAQTPVAGVWYHAVGTFDGTDRRIYINGSLSAGPSGGVTPATSAGVALVVGNYAGGFAMNGILADAAIYSRALSAGEINQHYLAGLGRS